MSKALDELEDQILKKKITDPYRIEGILKELLDMRYNELTVGRSNLNFVARDISDGFVLEKDKVAQLKS